jgi:hypothetical protein
MKLTGGAPGLYRVEIEAPASMSIVGVQTPHQRVAFVETEGRHLFQPEGALPFDPEFPIVTWETEIAKADYGTIVARIRPPVTDTNGWREAEAEFDLRHVSAADGRVQMLLSAPGIKKVGGKIRIDRVEVEYRRPPLEFGKLFDFFKPRS